MNDWRSKPRNGKAEFVKHQDVIWSRVADGETQVAIYKSLKDSEGLTLSASQFNRYIQKMSPVENSVSQDLGNVRESVKRAPPVASKLDLLSGERVKPQANFRQNLKQIRDAVENTDWSELINESKRTAPKG